MLFRSGVPQGKVTDWVQLPSQAYPGTLHDYCVYVPAQYDPAQPASLMIFQDGQAFLRLTGDYRVPYVFDNLIYRREMPVTIAVFPCSSRSIGAPCHRSCERCTGRTSRRATASTVASYEVASEAPPACCSSTSPRRRRAIAASSPSDSSSRSACSLS